MDFSPDCVEEWCACRDFDWFDAGAVPVVGISRSGPWLHRRFVDRLGLEFPLYSDPDLDVPEAYDVGSRAFGVSRRARRSCFLVGADGTIKYRRVGDHWLDPTLDTPPVAEIYKEISGIVDVEEPETFGL